MAKENFVAPDKIQVIIPYSDLEKMVQMSARVEEIERYIKRMDEQYAAIRGMFSECLEKIADIQKFVQD